MSDSESSDERLYEGDAVKFMWKSVKVFLKEDFKDIDDLTYEHWITVTHIKHVFQRAERPYEVYKYYKQSMDIVKKHYDLKYKELSREDYYYLITFTRDRKKSKDRSDDYVEKYIHVQAKRARALKIQRAVCCREHHKDGKLHWHIAMITTEPLRRDAFAYYEKLFGKVHISLSKEYKSWDELYGYICKEDNITELVNP